MNELTDTRSMRASIAAKLALSEQPAFGNEMRSDQGLPTCPQSLVFVGHDGVLLGECWREMWRGREGRRWREGQTDGLINT